jgi:hypothetical protein
MKSVPYLAVPGEEMFQAASIGRERFGIDTGIT